MTEMLKTGQRLEFELLNDQNQKAGYVYVSQFIDTVDSSNIIIAAPIHENRLIFIPLHAKIRVIFIHDSLGLHTFTGTVSGKEKMDNVAVLYVHIDSPLEKIQRRENFRLDCVLHLRYAVCPPLSDSETGKGADTDYTFKTAVSKNLSISGICMIANEPIPKDAILQLSLKLPEEDVIETTGRITRITIHKIGKNIKYELGIAFKDLKPSHKAIITRYIFEQQRLLLKKGHK